MTCSNLKLEDVSLDELRARIIEPNEYLGGTHLASNGGAWLVTVFGFAGMLLAGDEPVFDSCLPDKWKRLRFKVQVMGKTFEIDIDKTGATVRQGVAHKVNVSVNENDPLFWSDHWKSSLAPGESVVLTVNGRVSGSYWTLQEGKYAITASADDEDFIEELDETNNAAKRVIDLE